MDLERTKDQYILHSVDNALEIIDLLFTQKHLGTSEIAAQLHVGRATAFRLLATLENRGFVTKDASGKYTLSLKLFSIGTMVGNRIDLIQVAHPYLEELTRRTGEASHLVKLLDDAHVIFLDKVRAPGAVSLDTSIGYTKEIYRTATGKVLLAFSPPETVTRYIERQPFLHATERTDYTIQSKEAFLAALQHARTYGFAVNDREDMSWVSSYAAPLLDAQGHAIAAISLAGHSEKLSDHREQYVSVLQEIAEKISQCLT